MPAGIIQLSGFPSAAVATGKLTITRSFDTTTGSRASPGSAFAGNASLANNFFNGVDEACSFFERHFCRTPATIFIQFGWGTKSNSPFTGLFGSSPEPAGTNPYSLIRSSLIARAVTPNAISALGSFPVSDPTSGNINNRQAHYVAVLGQPRFNALDGWVGVDATQPYFFTQAGGAGSGFDFVGGVMHEISECMDRLRNTPGTQPNATTLQDMLTYSAPGVRQWDVGGYFSVDQGTTNDGAWNTDLGTGADSGDFAGLSAPGGVDACNAFDTANALAVFSQRDIDTLDCIGWQYVP